MFAGAVDRGPDERVVDAYARAMRDPVPEVRARAARSWGRWEDVHVSQGALERAISRLAV